MPKLAYDLMGDAFPANQPERIENLGLDAQGQNEWDLEPQPRPAPTEYKWVFANGQLEISPTFSHDDLAGHAGMSPNFGGPMAVGYVNVEQGKATWSIKSNMNAQALAKELKAATKAYGWVWGGMTTTDGEPIGVGSEFAPVKAFTFKVAKDHLYLSHNGLPSADGVIFTQDDVARVAGLNEENLEALLEWAEDYGFKIAQNDNIIKRIEDMQQFNNGSPDQNQEDRQYFPQGDQGQPSGQEYSCPYCHQDFPTFNAYLIHRRDEDSQLDPSAAYPDGPPGGFPELDMDKPSPFEPKFTPQQKDLDSSYVSHYGSYTGEAEKVEGFTTYAKVWGIDSPEHDQFVAYRSGVPVGFTSVRPYVIAERLEDLPEDTDLDFDAPLDHSLYKGFYHPSVGLSTWETDGVSPTHYEMADGQGLDWEDIQKSAFWATKGKIHFPWGYPDQSILDSISAAMPNYKFDAQSGQPSEGIWRDEPHFGSVDAHWVDMVKSSVPGAGTTLMRKIQKVYPELYTNATTSMGERLLKKTGWVQLEDHIWKWSVGTEPKDMIPASIPFIYDIKHDKIQVGYPGGRTQDLRGVLTPGGIVVGRYEPGGKLVVESNSNMPWTAHHLMRLWYFSFPHMEIKSLNMEDADGKMTRLAGQDIGGYLQALVAADPPVHDAYQALRNAGGEVFVVGGAVRDALMDKPPKDIDLMVTGLDPDQIQQTLSALPGKVNLTGKDFGVFRYWDKGHDVEIALPRRERSSGGGHKDFITQSDPTMKPEEDLLRRDFTANAMAVDLNNGDLIDPYGGLKDIQNKTLRTVRPEALAEDPLRVMRALVAASKHGLEPDDQTRASMTANAPSLHYLAPERIQAELTKMLKGPDPGRAIRLAAETGTLQHFLPEVQAAIGYDQQNPHHEQELGDHLISVMERAKQKKPDDPDFALTGLLHDIGKPDSRWTECKDCGWADNGPYTQCPQCQSTNMSGHYYESKEKNVGWQHEDLGADMARKRLNALRYPNDSIDRITSLISGHMWAPYTSEKGARKFLNQYGPHADDLLDLRWADQGGKSKYPNPTGEAQGLNLDSQRQLVDLVRQKEQQGQGATSLQNLAVNGNDLINAGITPGPILGQTLQYLLNQVLDNPELNSQQALIPLAQQYANGQAS